MDSKTLEKLSPEGREQIIEMEGQLRELEEERNMLDKLMERVGLLD